jgi:PAS domain S-box-containing protein
MSFFYHDRGHKMTAPSKTNQDLIEEISTLKQRIQELEKSESERKGASEVLRKSEEYFKAIIRNSSDIILIVDKLGTITYASPSIEHFLGYHPDELIGKRSLDLIVSEDKPKAIADFGRALLTKEILIPNIFRIRHKNGSERVLEGIGKNLLCNPIVAGFVMNVRDITDRKRTEEALRESEERFRTIFEQAAVGVAQVESRTGRFVRVNRKYCDIVGYSREEMLSKGYHDITSPDDLNSNVSDVSRLMAEEVSTFSTEKRYLHKNGSIVWVNLSVSPMRAEGQQPIFHIAIVEDITNPKRAEESLRQSEENAKRLAQENATMADIGRIVSSTLNVDEVYEAFAEQVKKVLPFDRIVISIIRPDKNTTRNAYIAGEGILDRNTEDTYPLEGSGHAEMLRTKSTFLIQTEDFRECQGRFSGLWSTFHAGFRSIMNVPLFSKGEIIGALLLRSRKHPAYTEGDVRLAERIGAQIAGAIANTLLYNDLSKTEKSLRESEENYRSLFQNASIGIFHSLPEGRFLRVNPALAQMFGYGSPAEMVSAITNISTQIYIDSKKHSNLLAATSEQTGWVYAENRYRRKDGTILTANLTVRKVLNPNSTVAYVEGFVEDITERKRMEEEKQSLEERLQRSEKMEALGQLAGGVAHDLNNVLGILSGYSELLLLETPDGHRSRGYAEQILQSTEKGAAIIQDLLTLARRGVTASEVINLNSVVSGFQKTPMFEKMKDYHPSVTFSTDCDKNLLNIKGSPVHLEKTLMNLVSNAAESISGKGEVKIRTENRYLDKAIRGYDEVKEGDYAVLTVSDTGMGIPAENREKIFEPFYTKKTMGRSGTGLGLAIVWGTIKDHNGYIDVQTKVGEGTTFTLYFPVTREELIAQQQKMPIKRYMGRGESILVVDDIAEQRDIAARLLTRLGYDVHVVSSGEEAVEYIKGNKADILVLDMIMAPGIDGLETYQRVLEINPKQKAILVSGFSETQRVRKAQELGAGAYVKKPYIMEKIGVAVRDELNR